MLEAFGLGVLGASSLLFAGVFACRVDVPARLVGILAGFGAGALIAAISFDLVAEAEDALALWQFALWMLVGVAVFLVADKLSGSASPYWVAADPRMNVPTEITLRMSETPV